MDDSTHLFFDLRLYFHLFNKKYLKFPKQINTISLCVQTFSHVQVYEHSFTRHKFLPLSLFIFLTGANIQSHIYDFFSFALFLGGGVPKLDNIIVYLYQFQYGILCFMWNFRFLSGFWLKLLCWKILHGAFHVTVWQKPQS